MGQAKQRGTFEQRAAKAIYLSAETEAWKEYYRREQARYESWLFYHLPEHEQRSITKKRIDDQMMMAQMAGFFYGSLGRMCW